MRGDARLEDVIPVADYFGFEDLQEVLKKQVKKVRDPLTNASITCIVFSFRRRNQRENLSVSQRRVSIGWRMSSNRFSRNWGEVVE